MNSIAIAIVLYGAMKYSVKVWVELRYNAHEATELLDTLHKVHRLENELAKKKEEYGE